MCIRDRLGPDYVDADAVPGPSDGDYGYWIKFNYVNTTVDASNVSDPYKWRAPFKKANFVPGMRTFVSDDKANFMYGEKEIWYLATVESKSHVAEFKISPREAVSYTHLDVYKRQLQERRCPSATATRRCPR